MRAAIVVALLLCVSVAAADGPRTTPVGFDHLVHARNLDVKGQEPLACARCHAEQKGKLVGKPNHAACFGACHGAAPTAPKKGTKIAFGDRERVCTACHAESLQGTPFNKKLAVAYPPYRIDRDFNTFIGHQQHAQVACTQCHDMRDKKAPPAVHDRCAGCHDGSRTPGRGPAMASCAGCHPLAVGAPQPPQLAVVHDSVTAVFSHTRHAARSALGRDCATCHAAIKTTDDTQLPRPTMQGCAATGCHDGKGAFATTTACTRCHDKAPERYEVFRTNARFLHGGVHASIVTERPCGGCHALGSRGDTLIANHDACTQCHADDFAKRKPEKCSACHNATEPWRRLVADRPPPDQTEFGVMLDHDKHPQDCVRCHSLRTSASELRPARGHAACSGEAGCHAAKTGPTPRLETCSGCHRSTLASARTQARLNAPWSVRATFTHAPHMQGGDGKPLPCRSCHTNLTGTDLVALPTPAKAACLPCHDAGKVAFSMTGTACGRCHPKASGSLTSLGPVAREPGPNPNTPPSTAGGR